MPAQRYEDTNISIREVQLVQLEILIEFDRICRSNNIHYQLFAGSLLGAVRHKGFIPWDDDVDVCLLRDDYERFLKCCRSDLNPRYFLQYYESDPRSILQFAKIRKHNTLFLNSVENGSGMHNGIYIDIFPLDNVKPDNLLGRIQPWVFNAFSILNSSRLKNRVLHARNRTNRWGRQCLHLLTKMIPKRPIDKCAQAVLKLFRKKETRYVNHLSNGVSKDILLGNLRERNSFYEIEYTDFEGHLFPIPKNYHDVLTRLYGDYTTLPPEHERIPHHGIYEIKL